MTFGTAWALIGMVTLALSRPTKFPFLNAQVTYEYIDQQHGANGKLSSMKRAQLKIPDGRAKRRRATFANDCYAGATDSATNMEPDGVQTLLEFERTWAEVNVYEEWAVRDSDISLSRVQPRSHHRAQRQLAFHRYFIIG